MTVAARNRRCKVRGMKKGILVLAGLMTSEATLGILFRVPSKCKDQLVRGERFRFIAPCSLLPLNVRFPRAMTGFAAHDDLLTRGQPCMGRLAVLHNFSAVATSTPIVPNKGIRRSC